MAENPGPDISSGPAGAAAQTRSRATRRRWWELHGVVGTQGVAGRWGHAGRRGGTATPLGDGPSQLSCAGARRARVSYQPLPTRGQRNRPETHRESKAGDRWSLLSRKTDRKGAQNRALPWFPPNRPRQRRVEEASRSVRRGRRHSRAREMPNRRRPAGWTWCHSPDTTIKATRPQNTHMPPGTRRPFLGGRGVRRPRGHVHEGPESCVGIDRHADPRVAWSSPSLLLLWPEP